MSKTLAALLVLVTTMGGCAAFMTTPDIDKEWNYGDPAGTRVKFQELESQHASGAPRDWQLELRTQIARTWSLEANFEKAHAILDEVEEHLQETSPLVTTRYHLERGRTFNSAGKKELAWGHFEQAYEAAKQNGLEFLAIDAAHMLAIAAKDFDEKTQWNLKALHLAQASKDERARKWQGSILNNLGWDHFETKDYEKALYYFDQCRAFFDETDQPKRERIARWSKAKTLRMIGRYDEALAIQQSLVEEWENDRAPDPYVFEELGELLLALGDSDGARPWFLKAWQGLSGDTWLQRNEPERLARLKKLGGA